MKQIFTRFVSIAKWQKKATKPLVVIAFLIISSLQGFSQSNIAITGTVLDENRQPLPGVSVRIKGATKGTITENDGSFKIEAPQKSTLVFSYLGYGTQELQVSEGNKTLRVQLQSTNNQLNQVVVIGYGEVKKRDLTGAISSLSANDIKNTPQAGIDQMLQGRVAGVSVTQNSGAPGGGISVKIRGISTFGSTEPLYVIDGVPIYGSDNKDAISAAGDGETSMSAVNFLNPEDILSVDVLKDASATAIYGSRGSNGVVIITTKKGKAGDSKVNFDSYKGVQTISSYIDLMNLKQYAVYKNDIADFTGMERSPLYANIDLLGTGTNWQKEIFQSADIENYQLSLSGGKEGLTYYISGNFFNQQGIVIGSGFKRKSLRANIESQIKPWLKLGLNATFGGTNQDITLTNNANNSYSNVIAMTIQQAPDVPVRNVDGTFGGPSDIDGLGAMSGANPVAQASTWKTNLDRNRLQSNVFLQTKFLRNFTFKTDFGSDLNWNTSDFFMPTFTWGRVINSLNTYRVQNQKTTNWSWRNVLTYQRKFADAHDITAMLGHEANENRWNQITSGRSKFASNELYSLNLGDPATATTTQGLGRSAMESFFGRLIYNYKGRYGLTATLRRDQSSNFAPGKQVGYFPSVSGSWTVSNESFMKNQTNTFNSIKLRGGYGELGNQNVAGYSWGSALSSIFVNASAFGTGLGQYISNFGNPDLTWEHQKQWNIGLDVSLLNRFDITVDLYNKTSDRFLFRATYPSITGSGIPNSGTLGMNPPYVNSGKMQNKGIDVSLGYHTDAKKPFTWKSSLVLSHYKNTVKELNSQTSDITQTLSVNGNPPITKTLVGSAVGQFYGYKAIGIFRTAADLATYARRAGNTIDPKSGTYLGDIIFQDTNKDGVINGDDRVVIGDPNPDFTFGFTNNFTYKNFDLGIFINGSYGNDIFNYTRVWGEGMTATSGNQMLSVNNRWTPVNFNSEIPRYANGDPNENAAISSRYIEDGSYLRIQNISLGYNFTNLVLKKFKGISNLRLYASVQNAYTFTKYSGFDPEVGSVNGNVFLNGIDLGRYPVSRTYTIGLNIGL